MELGEVVEMWWWWLEVGEDVEGLLRRVIRVGSEELLLLVVFEIGVLGFWGEKVDGVGGEVGLLVREERGVEGEEVVEADAGKHRV